MSELSSFKTFKEWGIKFIKEIETGIKEKDNLRLFLYFIVLFGIIVWAFMSALATYHAAFPEKLITATSTVLSISNSTTTNNTVVNGNGNATAVGYEAKATINNNYPQPTFIYNWVARYPGPNKGIYTEFFVWKVSYPDNEKFDVEILPASSSLSCLPTPPNTLTQQPIWANSTSHVDIMTSSNVFITEVTCTSTSPIIDNGKLFTIKY